MAIRKIAQLGEPLLRQRSLEVPLAELSEPRLQRLIDDMIETMRDADGAGLAAPQVYEPIRLAVIEVNQNPRYPTLPPIPLTVLVGFTTQSVERGVRGSGRRCGDFGLVFVHSKFRLLRRRGAPRFQVAWQMRPNRSTSRPVRAAWLSRRRLESRARRPCAWAR